MPIACFPCQNLEAFTQVSPRGDARGVRQESTGLKPELWDRQDPRDPGLYCAKCGESVAGDVEELGLTDTRVDFVSPGEFDAEALIGELEALRPDADWKQLELPAQPARYGELGGALAPAVAEALARAGRDHLYTHQAHAIDAALRGENTIQATAAGSGKSLGFIAPVLDALVRDDESTALVLFPLKALANDQVASLASWSIDDTYVPGSTLFPIRLSDDAPTIQVGRYDGNTLEHEKTRIRRDARLIIATPDIVHASLLRMATKPYKDKTSWSRFLRGLRYVVIDEIHSYQGVFGSSVANVIRRLRRVARRYGSDPQFLAASATIGNPIELAESLTGVTPFTLVDNDGSARRRRVVLVCNPPERSAARDHLDSMDDQGGQLTAEASEYRRIAPQTLAIDMVAGAALVSDAHAPIRTIGFCQSRNAVFQLAKRIQSRLGEMRRADLAEHVAPYAATFLADARSEEEARLRDGRTLAVISTSALELGIDIPDLSFAVLVGYPGQISSFRQRAGRVGRTGEGLAVLIVGDDPLQQLLARDPATLGRLLNARAEDVVVNAGVPAIAERYGLAPAQEELGGIAFEDAEFFGEDAVQAWLADATGAPDAEIRGISYWKREWSHDPYQNLRNSVPGHSYTVVAGTKGNYKPIGVIDRASATRDAFVPAIWSGPGGDLYRVVGFDEPADQVFCEGPVDVGYLTRGVPIDRVETTAAHHDAVVEAGTEFGYSALRITRQVFSYREQHFSGPDRSRPVERGWPPIDFDTDGLVISPKFDGSSGPIVTEPVLRAVEHLALSVAPALVACDPYDLDATIDHNTVYVYDSFGGGLRLSETLFNRRHELLKLCLDVVESCTCDSGCPSCIMLDRRPDGNKDLSKAGAIAYLNHVVDDASRDGHFGHR